MVSEQVESLLFGVELMSASGQVPRVDIDAIHNRTDSRRDWLSARMERLQRARTWLQQRGILVSVVNRDALVRRYRVTGKHEAMFAEDVIDLAIAHGLECDGQA